MKTKFLTLVVFTGAVALMISSCSFLRGTGSITTDDNSICSNYKNSDKSQLEVGLIHEMTDIYQKNSDKKDAKAVHLDLETLKTFLYHLEIEAKKQGIPSTDLGVRIYYARYPQMNTWTTGGAYNKDLSIFLGDPLTEQYEMKHTVILMPTKKEKNGNFNEDFNPFDISTYSNGLTPSYTPAHTEFNPSQLMFVMPLNDPNRSAQNHGQMYPPYPETGMTFN